MPKPFNNKSDTNFGTNLFKPLLYHSKVTTATTKIIGNIMKIKLKSTILNFSGISDFIKFSNGLLTKYPIRTTIIVKNATENLRTMNNLVKSLAENGGWTVDEFADFASILDGIDLDALDPKSLEQYNNFDYTFSCCYANK